MKKLDEFKNQSVLVVGDMMVDRYLIGTVERISPEAPVPVLRQTKVRHMLGGAGNVIVNLSCLGAKVYAMGRVGMDTEGNFFRETLRSCGADDRYIFSDGATMVKTRVSASNQQFIRIDEETVAPPSPEILTQVRKGIGALLDKVTVVIISDYAKGFISQELAQTVIRAARAKGVPVLVDPKGNSAAKYAGATAVTPNNKEFVEMTGLPAVPDEETIRRECLRLCRDNDYDYLIFTRSEKGISMIRRADGAKRDHPAVEREVVDVTGAGDTVVSVLALGVAAGMDMDECIDLANVAASIVISRFGAAQTTVGELSAALGGPYSAGAGDGSALAQLQLLRQQGKRIVFTNGCFDLVHAGHISSFRQARRFGDILVVGLNSDASIRRIKGPQRPIVGLEHRMALLQTIRYVDFVIPFEEDTPQRLIEQIRPDVLVKGKDWEGKEVAGADFIASYGGRVEFIDLEQGLSTTNIIEKIKLTLSQ